MWELVKAGGWLMMPIVICSIIALIIIIERSSTLQFDKIVPIRLREQLITRLRENGSIGRTQLLNVKDKTPLGDILLFPVGEWTVIASLRRRRRVFLFRCLFDVLC